MTHHRKRLYLSYRHTIVLCLVFFSMFMPQSGRPQTFLASVSGIVNDPTGAVVPNVKITVTDIARGVPVNANTNQDGVYVHSEPDSQHLQSHGGSRWIPNLSTE